MLRACAEGERRVGPGALRRFLQRSMISVSAEEAHALLARLDEDGDGYIGYNDLVRPRPWSRCHWSRCPWAARACGEPWAMAPRSRAPAAPPAWPPAAAARLASRK